MAGYVSFVTTLICIYSMAQGIDLLYTHIVKCEPNMLLSLCIYKCTTHEHLLCIYSGTCLALFCVFFWFSFFKYRTTCTYRVLNWYKGRPLLDPIELPQVSP